MQVDHQKFAEVVLYILCHAHRPSMTKLMKLLALVDFEYYRGNLRPLTGLQYVALDRGPAPDGYQQMLQTLIDSALIKKTTRNLKRFPREKVEYEALRDPDLSCFTNHETEVLTRTVSIFGPVPTHYLIKFLHTEPWSSYYDPKSPGQKIPWDAVRWLDNTPDDDDEDGRRAAAESLGKPNVLDTIRRLNEESDGADQNKMGAGSSD